MALTWTNFSLYSPWTAYGSPQTPPGYAVDSAGVVHLRGTIKGGSLGQIICWLPTEIRALYRLHLACVGFGSADEFGSVSLPAGSDADYGYIVAGKVGSNGISLDGVSYVPGM